MLLLLLSLVLVLALVIVLVTVLVVDCASGAAACFPVSLAASVLPSRPPHRLPSVVISRTLSPFKGSEVFYSERSYLLNIIIVVT